MTMLIHEQPSQEVEPLEPLTVEERHCLTEHEATIEGSLNRFLEVGRALFAIKEGKLYRGTHDRWDRYLAEKWDLGYSYAYRLIEAAEVVEQLSPVDGKLPENEGQVRMLSSVAAPEERQAVWEAVVLESKERGRTIDAPFIREVSTPWREKKAAEEQARLEERQRRTAERQAKERAREQKREQREQQEAEEQRREEQRQMQEEMPAPTTIDQARAQVLAQVRALVAPFVTRRATDEQLMDCRLRILVNGELLSRLLVAGVRMLALEKGLESETLIEGEFIEERIPLLAKEAAD